MKKNILHSFISSIILSGLITCQSNHVTAQKPAKPSAEFTGYKTIKVKPSQADPAVHAWDSVHIVYYDTAIKNNKILLWLTGTNGSTNNVPAAFFSTALSRGYRIVALSFMSVPGVSQVCVGKRLNKDVDCAAEFRRKRVYGDNNFSGISDEPQDAFIPRLVKLLQYLSKNDVAGNWSQYLDNNGKPAWNKIAIAGQSQGGGMAEFIAKNEHVARVISFSGGWDYSDSKSKTIAGWYSEKFVTPLDNIYATYNVNEKAAEPLAEICKTMKLPADHVFALNGALLRESNNDNPYHGDGIKNPAYKPVWLKMLGSGL